jgi:membrane-bound ClpP family serine protease
VKLILLIGVLTGIAALATLVVVALYLHKRAGAGDIKLIGELARVDTKLDPEGTVIVCGELWRARSKDRAHISTQAKVRVVGFEGHLALVEACDLFSNTLDSHKLAR